MRSMLTALCLALGAAAAGAAERVAVIVASDARLSRVGVDEIRDLYLGRPSSLSGRWEPVVLPDGDPARERFDRAVLGMTSEQFTAYWVAARIRGAPEPPRQVPSVALMRETVQTGSGVIGYVPERAAGGLRVVTVSGTDPDLVMAGIEAQEGGALSLERQAAVLVHAVLYDRDLNAAELRIGVLYDPSARGAEARARRLAESMSRSATVPVTALLLPYGGDLGAVLGRERVAVLYVAPELSDRLDAITRVTHATRVFTVAGRRELVEGGLCAGVYLDGLRSRLVVNPRACHEEGVHLSANLMRVAARVD
jgi:hypothetical protein